MSKLIVLINPLIVSVGSVLFSRIEIGSDQTVSLDRALGQVHTNRFFWVCVNAVVHLKEDVWDCCQGNSGAVNFWCEHESNQS